MKRVSYLMLNQAKMHLVAGVSVDLQKIKDVATRIINHQILNDEFGRLHSVTPRPPEISSGRAP